MKARMAGAALLVVAALMAGCDSGGYQLVGLDGETAEDAVVDVPVADANEGVAEAAADVGDAAAETGDVSVDGAAQ